MENENKAIDMEKVKRIRRALLRELNEAYPDGVIDMAQWDHTRWDRSAGWLVRQLGYESGRAFLEDSGFRIRSNTAPSCRAEEEAKPRSEVSDARRRVQAKGREQGRNNQQKKAGSFSGLNVVLLLAGSVIFAVGVVVLLHNSAIQLILGI